MATSARVGGSWNQDGRPAWHRQHIAPLRTYAQLMFAATAPQQARKRVVLQLADRLEQLAMGNDADVTPTDLAALTAMGEHLVLDARSYGASGSELRIDEGSADIRLSLGQSMLELRDLVAAYAEGNP